MSANSTIISTLRTVLAKKAAWLADESDYLVEVVDRYVESGKNSLSSSDLEALHLSAYYKNLGALYISDQVLSYDLRFEPEEYSGITAWQSSSQAIAKASGHEKVVQIVSSYHLRQPPRDPLASLFQVINCWGACRTAKGWRGPLSVEESLRALHGRAEMGWSDPDVVQNFVDHLQVLQGISLRGM